MFALGLVASAEAQTKIRGGGTPVRTRVVVAAPIVPAFGFPNQNPFLARVLQ